jgi:rod shape-determining protein MreD
MSNLLPKYIIRFLLVVVIQIFLLNNIQLSGYINPYWYVIFILLLPLNTPRWAILISAFFLGYIIDLFCYTPGMHAMSCLIIGYIRNSVFNTFFSYDKSQPGMSPGVLMLGLPTFIRYTLVLVFIHHFILFNLEVFKFSLLFYTLLRIVISTFFTSLLIVISQFFIFRE